MTETIQPNLSPLMGGVRDCMCSGFLTGAFGKTLVGKLE
jgi:hypothetical protein